MDDLITQLEQLTMNLIGHINDADEAQLTNFVEQREKILNLITKHTGHAKIVGEHKTRIENILEYDLTITAKMNELKHLAMNELSKVAQSRMQKHGYDANYHYDGILFDQKK